MPSIIQDLTEAFSAWNTSQILDPKSYPSSHMVLRIRPPLMVPDAQNSPEWGLAWMILDGGQKVRLTKLKVVASERWSSITPLSKAALLLGNL